MATIVSVLSMMLDDAVDQRLIPTNPYTAIGAAVGGEIMRCRGRRGVFAMPEHVVRIARCRRRG